MISITSFVLGYGLGHHLAKKQYIIALLFGLSLAWFCWHAGDFSKAIRDIKTPITAELEAQP